MITWKNSDFIYGDGDDGVRTGLERKTKRSGMDILLDIYCSIKKIYTQTYWLNPAEFCGLTRQS